MKKALFIAKRSKVFRNFLSLAGAQVGNYIIPFLVIPYLTRTLGPSQFGLITFAQVFISYFMLIINYGFEYTATRKISMNKDDKDEIASVFWNVLFAKAGLFVISTIVLLLLLQIPAFHAHYGLFITTHLINIGFLLYPSWFFQGMQELRIVAALSFVLRLTYAILVFILIKTKEDYMYNNLLLSLTQLLISVALVVIAIKKYAIPYKSPVKSKILQLLSEGKFFFLSTLIINVYTYTNTFLLGLLSTQAEASPQAEAAYFNVVYRIIFAIQGILLMPFNMSFFPYISESFHKKQYAESHKKLMNACYLIIGATLAGGIVVFLGSKVIIALMFGAEFSKSVGLLRILAFIPVVLALVNVFGYNGLLSLHEDKKFLYITFGAACFSLSLNLFLVPRYQSEATAIIWIVTETFVSLFCFLFYKKALHKKINAPAEVVADS